MKNYAKATIDSEVIGIVAFNDADPRDTQRAVDAMTALAAQTIGATVAVYRAPPHLERTEPWASLRRAMPCVHHRMERDPERPARRAGGPSLFTPGWTCALCSYHEDDTVHARHEVAV